MRDASVDLMVAASEALASILERELAGKPPEIVGAVLCQLLAIYIAGHHPEIRQGQLEAIVDTARQLIPLEIESLIATGKVGQEWRDECVKK